MRVLLALSVASLLLLGTSLASPALGEDSDTVVEEAEWIAAAPTTVLVEEDRLTQAMPAKPPPAAPKKMEAKPIFAMTCVQRKQEALRTLMNLNAAKTLQQAATNFHVQDTRAEWRVQQWHTRYIDAATNYAFFCEQTEEENQKVTRTIHEKEGLEARKAALRGLQDATHKRREKAAKARSKAKELSTKKAEAAHEDKQKKLIKRMAAKARLERLHSYPQASEDLLGFVLDASSGKGIAQVNIESKCPFDQYQTSTKTSDEGGFSKFHLVKGITGPRGYRCYLTYTKDGFIPLRFRVLIQSERTQAIFRQATLMPKLPSPPKYRIVMQYGTQPADLDAHLQVFSDGKKVDIAGHRGSDPHFTYTTKGSADAFPFATLDLNKNLGYGPQTHSIHELQEGSYGYYVKNYDYHFSDNIQFSHSDARVFVYEGNKLRHRFAIRNAQGSPTKVWQVFNIKCKKNAGAMACKVNTIGTYVEEMPTSPDIAQVKQTKVE